MTVLQLTFQPFGILNVLRERFVIPVGVTCLLRVALLSPKDTYLYKVVVGLTIMLSVATTTFSVVYYALLETRRFGKLRAVFDSRPWRNRENVYLISSTDIAYSSGAIQGKCPFSKKAPMGNCPICSTSTSTDGYHHGDPEKIHNTVGISMIEYEKAREASQLNGSPIMGRMKLDAMINYRGNYLFGTISPSCKGCYIKTWCWNVVYRMTWQSAILGFISMLCTFVFQEDIQIFYIDMKNILLCISAFFSLSTACMQISILATAVVFVSEHPFMDISTIPKFLSVNMDWAHYFANSASKYGVAPTKKYWDWITHTNKKNTGERQLQIN